MNNFKIKKILRNLYSTDLTKNIVDDGDELITYDGVSEFFELFKLYDLQNNFICTPGGYERGLLYKKTGEVLNSPAWFPELVTFNLSFFGLKRNAIYKITVVARDTGDNYVVSKNRSLLVTNSQNELLLNEDLTGSLLSKEYHTIFRTTSNEETIFFKIGKVAIKSIILDEVELEGQEEKQNQEIIELKDVKFDSAINLATYSIFDLSLNTNDPNQRYCSLTKFSGKGLNLYFDKKTNEYVLEKDNREEVLTGNLNNLEYVLDFNTYKVLIEAEKIELKITELSSDLSPNTLKGGFVRFAFVGKDGKNLPNTAVTGKLYIFINQLL